MKAAHVICNKDNVAVALRNLAAGECAAEVCLAEDIPAGHKFACRVIKAGDAVIIPGTGILRRTPGTSLVPYFR